VASAATLCWATFITILLATPSGLALPASSPFAPYPRRLVSPPSPSPPATSVACLAASSQRLRRWLLCPSGYAIAMVSRLTRLLVAQQLVRQRFASRQRRPLATSGLPHSRLLTAPRRVCRRRFIIFNLGLTRFPLFPGLHDCTCKSLRASRPTPAFSGAASGKGRNIRTARRGLRCNALLGRPCVT
jgi:hypothetical protein